MDQTDPAELQRLADARAQMLEKMDRIARLLTRDILLTARQAVRDLHQLTYTQQLTLDPGTSRKLRRLFQRGVILEVIGWRYRSKTGSHHQRAAGSSTSWTIGRAAQDAELQWLARIATKPHQRTPTRQGIAMDMETIPGLQSRYIWQIRKGGRVANRLLVYSYPQRWTRGESITRDQALDLTSRRKLEKAERQADADSLAGCDYSAHHRIELDL